MEKIFEKDSIPSRMIHRKSFKFEVYFLILTLEKKLIWSIYILVINAKKIAIGFSK